jgi:HSP20 family protein
MKNKEEDEESIVEGVVEDILPGIGGLVKRLKRTSPEFGKRIEETDEEIKKRLKEGYSGKPRIKYGYSVRTLVEEEEEKEKVEPKEGVKTKIEILEPMVDIFDEGDYIKLIAELPGVSEEDIKVEIEKRKIVLDARSKERRYHKTIELPCACAVKDVKKRYKNGILELEVVKDGA